MQKRDLIIILIIGLLIVIFAVQNASSIEIELWFFKFNSPISLIIIGSVVLGALISWFFMFIEIRKHKKTIGKMNYTIKKLKKELSDNDPLSNIDT